MFNKKILSIFPVILLILSVFVLAQEEEDRPPPPDFGDGGDNIAIYDSLKIIGINTKVDGKKETIQNSGEKIAKEAKQESDIEFEINVKNIWDKEIKNIEVKVTIKNIDDGDDLKEDADIYNLAPGDSEKVDVNFDLPLKVDDDIYDVKIDVKGKDENNNIHTTSWTLKLEVEKDKHNVKITKASISPSILSCSRSTNLIVELLNLGRDEEEVKLEIKNKYLGIDIKEKDIELDTGTDKDAEYEKTYRLNIPNKLESGTYPITIKAYYNKDKSIATKKANLVVEDCKQIKQTTLIKTLPPTLQETIGTAKQPVEKETSIIFTYEEPIILLSIIILIVLIGLVIFLVGAIVIHLRK